MKRTTTIRAALTVAALLGASAAGAQDRQSVDDLQPVPDSAFQPKEAPAPMDLNTWIAVAPFPAGTVWECSAFQAMPTDSVKALLEKGGVRDFKKGDMAVKGPDGKARPMFANVMFDGSNRPIALLPEAAVIREVCAR